MNSNADQLATMLAAASDAVEQSGLLSQAVDKIHECFMFLGAAGDPVLEYWTPALSNLRAKLEDAGTQMQHLSEQFSNAAVRTVNGGSALPDK